MLIMHGSIWFARRIGDWKLIDGKSMKPDVRPSTAEYRPLCLANSTTAEDCLPDLHSSGPWLFNLRKDPYESHNLFASETARVVELRAALADAVAGGAMVWPLNAPGQPGSKKAPLTVTCPDGVWTPWLPPPPPPQ